jgi:hypothetical protein
MAQATQVRDEAKHAARRHLTIRGRPFGQIAQRATRGHRLVPDVVSAHARAACARRQEPGDDLHRGRLAGAVRAEEAEHFAGLDLETDSIDGRQPRISLA